MLFCTLMEIYRDWRRYNAGLSELRSLSDRELADIGISTASVLLPKGPSHSHKLHQAMVVAPIPPSHFGSSKSSAIASAMCLGVYIENSPRIRVRFAPVDVRVIRLKT
jgi:hypothetical protein